MRVITSLRSLTVKLQKKSNDILAAYELVSTVWLDLELLKSNCEEEFHQLFGEITATSLIFQFPLHRLLPDKFITRMLQQTVQSLTIIGTS